MNLFTTEKLLEHLSPEGVERAIHIANLQDILMALDSSNIEIILDYLIRSIFLSDPDLIIRLVDNIFVCCKYREFYVDQYAFLIYTIYQTFRNANRIQSSVNLGFLTKENVDKTIFTYRYLAQNDRVVRSYAKGELNCFTNKNEKASSRRKSLILGENLENELNENENQIVSIININQGKNNKNNEIENGIKTSNDIKSASDDFDPEFDAFFNDFIMNSNSNLDLFRDKVFTINQSVSRQPWRLFCIYKCMEIFNNDDLYQYVQEFYKNSLAFELDQMLIFAYFAPQIKFHFRSLFDDLYNKMKKKYSISQLPHAFNDFYSCFEYNNSTNWKDHSFILENCGFCEGTPLYAIRHDDVDFFIQEKMNRNRPKNEEKDFGMNHEVIDYNMRVKENIFLRYRQLQFRCTLLQLAAYYGSEKCFSFLLENGADPYLTDDIGLNLMHFAVVGGSNKIILELQKRGFSFDTSVISLIVESYRLNLFQWILSVSKIDFEESYLETGTIFHRACSSNNILIILFCISNGVNVNVFDNLNLTPLFYAASNRSIDAINVLLAHKDINWSLADKFKDTPLHGAAKSYDCDTFIAVMNHKDADINVRDFKQRSPLRYAIGDGRYDLVRMILSKYEDKVDFDEVDIDGCNLLITNSISYYLSTFILISNCQKINLNRPRNDGTYLLHLIVTSNSIDCVRILLDQERIDPNVKLPNGTTPLHIAAKQGFTEIVQILIDNQRIDPNIKDCYDFTPLHLAIKHIHTDVVRILVNSEKVDREITAVFFFKFL